MCWLQGGCSTTESPKTDIDRFRTVLEKLPPIEFVAAQTRVFSGKYEDAAPTVTFPPGIYRATSQWCPAGNPVGTLYRAPAMLTVVRPVDGTRREFQMEGWLYISENNGWVGVWLDKHRLPTPLEAPRMDYRIIETESVAK